MVDAAALVRLPVSVPRLPRALTDKPLATLVAGGDDEVAIEGDWLAVKRRRTRRSLFR